MQIKSIKEADFSCNTSEGIFFKKINNQFIMMNFDEQKEFIRNNRVIGYEGSDVKLSSWARKQSKGLSVWNLPGETIEQKRQLLWQAINSDNEEDRKPYRWLISLAKQELNNLTFWYLSSHDKPVAELIVRFVNWYSQQ